MTPSSSHGTRADELAVLADVSNEILVDGTWGPGRHGTFTVTDPATGDALAEVADGGPADGLAALDGAARAFPDFAAMAPRSRADILRRAHESLLARADAFALLITLEMGKPLAESHAEVVYAASFLRWASEEAVRVAGTFSRAESGNGRVLTMRQPVGPCLFVTPWNFPLAMVTRKLAPALAAGCTAVVKPAEQTPLSALAFVQLLVSSGVPPGVVNVVTTSRPSELVEPLLVDLRLRKLSFTGSTEVGRHLMARSAANVLRLSMELGGNAPVIVAADADLRLAVEGTLLAKMRAGGMACTSANRILVHADVLDEFVARLSARMSSLQAGRGTDPAVEVGPLIDQAQRTKVSGLVTSAVAGGATAICGGREASGPGFFYEPTVLIGVSAQADITHQEIFGPVAPIQSFVDDDEALQLANDTEYGLAAYVFTGSLARAQYFCEGLETGMVGLNQGVVSNAQAPFGGIKHSGYGREGGSAGMEEYLFTKYVAIADT